MPVQVRALFGQMEGAVRICDLMKKAWSGDLRFSIADFGVAKTRRSDSVCLSGTCDVRPVLIYC